MTDDHSVELLISHVNLYAYGCDIIKEDKKSRAGGTGGGGAHRKCVDAGDRAAP